MGFDKNVFINCPFDETYRPLLRSLLFVVIYLGFVPRIALEQMNSGEPRISKILSLIKESRYAIHDLSRLKADNAGDYFRLNMPLELGIDIGCRSFKGGKWTDKRLLILETEKYRYQAAISDLSNSDIETHENNPTLLIYAVRNWLNAEAKLKAPGSSHIEGRFFKFMSDNYDELKARHMSDDEIKHLPVAELMECMTEWVSKTRQAAKP